MRKPATTLQDLIASKTEAKPTTPSAPPVRTKPWGITTYLEHNDYVRLKQLGISLGGRSGQDMVVEAIRDFLAKHGA